MIISKHFKDPKGYKLVRLIEDHLYTFDRQFTKLKLVDLPGNRNIFLLWFKETKIVKPAYWITRNEQIKIILQREEL